MKGRKRSLFLILIISVLMIGCGKQNDAFAQNIEAKNDFVDLEKVLIKDGYLPSKQEQFVYTKENPSIVIQFRPDNGTVKKNDFIFYVQDQFEKKENKIYMAPSSIEKIINKNISFDESSEIILTPLILEKHEWTEIANGLVAHAAGGILNIAGTNCYEAIVTNYNLGHRVFEIDFNLTTDGGLAAVHDWHGYLGIKSSDEWKAIKIADVFQSLMIEDILEIMMVNQDMILITDTKSFEYTEEQIKQQFQIIVDAAKEIDISVLDRIVPQIYDQPMYELITEIYPFESIIYTLYASPDSDEEVIAFTQDKDDIKVITMGPVRFSENFYEKLTQNDKYIYFFTLNDLEEIKGHIEKGIHGFYTDFIYPDMLEEQ